MKVIATGCFSLLALSVAVFGDEIEDSKSPWNKTINDAFRQCREADFVIDYLTHLDKYNLGIGRIENDAIKSVLLDLEQIEPFFKRQKHKDLIVIVFGKNTWDAERRNKKILEINRSFFRVGFKRVVVQQASGGIGRQIWSDQDNPNTRENEQDAVE